MGGGTAIFAVAQDRSAERGAMGAQLMRTPGDRQERKPTRPVADMVHHAVIGARALAVLVIGLHSLAAGTNPLGERQIDPPLG